MQPQTSVLDKIPDWLMVRCVFPTLGSQQTDFAVPVVSTAFWIPCRYPQNRTHLRLLFLFNGLTLLSYIIAQY